MSATFTRYPYTGPADQLTPVAIEAPWTSARATRTIAHQLLESETAVYTLRHPGPRTGSMLLHFASSADAHAAAEFFSTPAEFDLFPVDPPELAARFVVVGGSIPVTQTAVDWTVTLPWSEVLP
jgi:hypothetical protein